MQPGSPRSPNGDTPKSPRRYDLDWLRVLATFVVFLYHSSRLFNASESWHVKNNQVSAVFDWVAALAVIMLLYEFAIRRHRILRFLFGMRPQ
jgi:peptidoglycan/LPS O-acetylase OafA/YrhL